MLLLMATRLIKFHNCNSIAPGPLKNSGAFVNIHYAVYDSSVARTLPAMRAQRLFVNIIISFNVVGS